MRITAFRWNRRVKYKTESSIMELSAFEQGADLFRTIQKGFHIFRLGI